ncbi:MAG: ABC transporter permease [Thermodesulfovibrionia bacterium]|nr:ABC transporter permease [Thermodesulfovibrionia bacterium]
MVFTDAMRAIAHKELSDKLKGKWVIIIGAGFALFTVIISYFGVAPAGVTGFRSLDATVASLTSLVTYFIPILALTLGGGIVADEKEKGTLEIFLSSPISIGDFIIGKFLGLVIALALSTAAGFGIAGVILVIKIGVGTIGSFLVFIVNSITLGIIFLSISFLISILLYERTKVIALTIFLWLFFTILYDLGLIGLLVITKGDIGTQVFSILLMFNPVDVYRILNFVSIGEFKILIGLASVEFPSYMRASLLWGISLLWILVPLVISYYSFKRRYLE